MKKILSSILIFVFSLSVFITPAFAMEYAGYSTQVVIQVNKTIFEDFDFILNTLENPKLEVYFCHKDETVIFDFEKIYSTASAGNYYFKTSVAGKNFDIDSTGKEIFSYDIYLLDDDGNRIYHTYIYNATSNTVLFNSFAPYIEEPEEPEEDITQNVTVDMTETNNKLDEIHKSLITFISIFFFYFGYKIVKEIIFNLKERK